MQRFLVPLTVAVLALLCAACGSSSATTATGNKSTCDDFFAYGTFVQSLKSQPSQTVVDDRLQRLEVRLMVDGPTAQSSALAETANREVAAIKAKEWRRSSRAVECLNLRLFTPRSFPSWLVSHRPGIARGRVSRNAGSAGQSGTSGLADVACQQVAGGFGRC